MIFRWNCFCPFNNLTVGMDLNSVKYCEMLRKLWNLLPNPPHGEKLVQTIGKLKIEGSRNIDFTKMAMINFTIQEKVQRLLGKNDNTKWLTD